MNSKLPVNEPHGLWADIMVAHYNVTLLNADFSTPFALFVLLNSLGFIYEKPKGADAWNSKIYHTSPHSLVWFDE